MNHGRYLVVPFLATLALACSTESSGGDAAAGAGGTTGGSGNNAGGSTSAGAGGTSAGGSSTGGMSAGGTSAGGSGGTSAGGTSAGGSSAGGAGGDPGTAGMTGTGGTASFTEAPDGPLKGIVAAHNKARAGVNPPAATPIPNMSWDTKVAADAQAWADGCDFKHDPKLGTLKQGQNIYASAGSVPTPEGVVGDWVSEVADYDYASNSCASGQVCGHYTQVVWAKSTGLGCGQKTCTVNSPFGGGGKWDLWVCNYSPPGNFNGQKPY